jgi:putative NADH-flavin reductase
VQQFDMLVLQHIKVVRSVCCAAAGATGGVGKRVVQQLLAQGRVVRALVRDVDKAKQLLVSHM